MTASCLNRWNEIRYRKMQEVREVTDERCKEWKKWKDWKPREARKERKIDRRSAPGAGTRIKSMITWFDNQPPKPKPLKERGTMRVTGNCHHFFEAVGCDRWCTGRKLSV